MRQLRPVNSPEFDHKFIKRADVPGSRRQLALWRVVAGVCIAVGGGAGIARADAPVDSGHTEMAQAMGNAYPALVRIFVVAEEPENGRLDRVLAAGSGSIISRDGYIVTNHHVAGHAKRIKVNLADGEEIEATRVGTDAMADICVLKLKLETRTGPSKALPVAEWGDSDALQVGNTVFAMGCPGAMSQSVTRGIVANTQMILPTWEGKLRLDGEDVGATVRWITHDAVIFGGNSGGPLVDLGGKIVGINEIGLDNLSGAIPGNLAHRVADEIIKCGFVSRSWAGLECQPRLKGDGRNTGALIAGVIKDSPASKAGLQPGDLLTSWNQQPVNVELAEQIPMFYQMVCSTPVGQVVKLAYLRDGDKHETELTTKILTKAIGEAVEMNDWGMVTRDITPAMALEHKFDSTRGVLVDSIHSGGGAADSKMPLRPQDVIVAVNGKQIDDVASLVKVTDQLTTGKGQSVPVLVRVRRETSIISAVIKIGKDDPAQAAASAHKCWAGMSTQVLTADLADALKLKGKRGVVVTEVFKGHPAEAACIKVGDVITALNDTAIEASQPEDGELFSTMVRQYDIGVTITLSIIRDGAQMKIAMPLEAAPVQDENDATYEDKTLQFTAREMSFDDRKSRQLADKNSGVLIEKVDSGSWAQLAGLEDGDIVLSVAGRPSADIPGLKDILAQIEKDKPRRVVFFVLRGIHTHFVEVEPGW